MEGELMFKSSRGRLAALSLSMAVAALGSTGVASAAGGHTQTYTDNYHGTQVVTNPNPCTGNPLVGTADTNSVLHVTYFVDSDESWMTFTEEDKFTAVDQGTGVVYTGHDAIWGNQNINRQDSNGTFTGSIRATGSDGSAITYHEVGHITMLPDGNVAVSFDKPSLSCG
jgi:hypothetical protein